MSKRTGLLFFTLFLSLQALASKDSQEQIYDEYIESIKYGNIKVQSEESLNTSIFLDALWDMAEEGQLIDLGYYFSSLSLTSDRDLAKAFVLAHKKRDFVTAKKLYKSLMKKLKGGDLASAGLYTLWAHDAELVSAYPSMYKLAKENFFEDYHYFKIISKFMPKTNEEITGLLTSNQTFNSDYLKSYNNSPKLFLLCRSSRDYPCLFILKNNDGEFLRDGNDIWTLPALAHGREELRFHTTNGYTPQGIHTMDSVMPLANRPVAFGKYRRVKLNFLPETNGNNYELDALNEEAKYSTWWHEANIAREVERKFLRIHGTGRINDEPKTTYYPHITSSGCITVREGQYPEANYYDQRIMLDALMRASDLDEVYSNEEKIKGLLYVIEIDNQNKAVTRNDLKKFGI